MTYLLTSQLYLLQLSKENTAWPSYWCHDCIYCSL